MSYKVTVSNYYEDGSVLKLAFDTNSALLHEASRDAEQAVFMQRLEEGFDPQKKPFSSNITYNPFRTI